MKSLGVEGRSVGVCAGVCVAVVEVTLETYDKEGINQGESNDDKRHSLT